MKTRILLLSLVLGSFAAAAAAQKVDVAAELQSLVRAERDFARAAAEKGTREAFLANLADDGIVFSPGPVNGKKSWGERPPSRGLLSWEPIYADVSRAGDLGYTTGPWEFRPGGAGDDVAAHGQYMTIWKKQPGGDWKFVLDIGTQNPPPKGAGAALHFPADFRKNTAKDKLNLDVSEEREALLKMERRFAEAAASKGAAQAFAAYAAEDLRLMRDASFPVVGRGASIAALSAEAGGFVWRPTFADVSRSGDLGYAYGTYGFTGSGASAGPTAQGNYVRIWKKRDGTWRVVLDLLNPVAPAKN